MFLLIGRTLKESAINFWRNISLSMAAVSVLALTLFMLGFFFVLSTDASNFLKDVENKINISVYFKAGVTEERILEIKSKLEEFDEVQSIRYVTKEQAYEDFKKSNASNPVIMQSLQEIGENPLPALLVIKANKPEQYEAISKHMPDDFKEDFSLDNFERNKEIINNLKNKISQAEKIGLFLGIIFGLVSILIIFNTIRIAIYTHKQEIEVMRLVGASNLFIRLPFIFEGIIYGLMASLMATAMLFLLIKFSNFTSIVTPRPLIDTYLGSILFILIAQAVIGIVLGVVSGLIAMRKYLKI